MAKSNGGGRRKRKKKASEPAVDSNGKRKTGFALLSAEERAAMGSRGGRRAHLLGTAHEFTPSEARRAARKPRGKRKVEDDERGELS